MQCLVRQAPAWGAPGTLLPYAAMIEPIALLSTYAYVLVARKTMPANDLNDLVAWLRADPDKAAFDACTDNAGARANAFFCS